MRHADVTLDDKFLLTEGRVFITGVQALLRVMIDQHRLDKAAGLNTAGFVSGYRGSPLGGLDQQFVRAERFLAPNDIIFQAGLNEDLAAEQKARVLHAVDRRRPKTDPAVRGDTAP